MQKFLTGLALMLAIGTAVVAGRFLASNPPADPTDLQARLAALEARLDRLDERLEAAALRRAEQPSLAGLAPRVGGGTPEAGGPAARVDAGNGDEAAPARTDLEPVSNPQRIQAMVEEAVEEAVEKKAAQIRLMEDKEPSIDTFAETLALEPEQQQVVEEEVLRGQREIQTILETLADDGTNFMDEVVEVMADGIAHPGENPGKLQDLFRRLMSEEVPGTDETYAVRLEAVKESVRRAFRRTFSDEQYATFEAWQMDPTEIQEVPSSPWNDVEARVILRARELGAVIPKSED